ncbi:hypothetical protein PB16LOC_04573 [Pectobacterium versatile]|nr:hypothetical protein PB16LOC_04573 [Pectobacterium versatile]
MEGEIDIVSLRQCDDDVGIQAVAADLCRFAPGVIPAASQQPSMGGSGTVSALKKQRKCLPQFNILTHLDHIPAGNVDRIFQEAAGRFLKACQTFVIFKAFAGTANRSP